MQNNNQKRFQSFRTHNLSDKSTLMSTQHSNISSTYIDNSLQVPNSYVQTLSRIELILQSLVEKITVIKDLEERVDNIHSRLDCMSTTPDSIVSTSLSTLSIQPSYSIISKKKNSLKKAPKFIKKI